MDGLNNNSGPSLILVKTALDKLRDDTTQQENIVGKATAMHPVIFTQDTADKAAVVTSVIGGGGYFAKNTDDVSGKKTVAKRAATAKTTTIAEFNQNLSISRTFMADQQMSAVARSVRQATVAWGASRDRNAFNGVYGQGFVSTTFTTIDGVAPYSNSHTNQNGDTVDNLETAALTDSGLNTTVNSLRQQINQAGVIVGYEPKVLLTPGVLHITGMQVAKSVLRAGTGNNDLNYWSEMYPGMEVCYSPFLDAASTTAYYVMTSGHDFMRFEREAFFSSLTGWETNENDQYIYKLRAREEVDTISYVGQVGNQGTA